MLPEMGEGRDNSVRWHRVIGCATDNDGMFVSQTDIPRLTLQSR